MNNPMTDFRVVESTSNAAAFFNNTYSALVAAMMNALGESSLGVSNIDRFQQDKTATEVKQLTLQRNARDNFNQMFLAEAIERQMKLWHSMNQSLIFADENKKNYVLRIAGIDALKFFQEAGLDSYGLTEGAADVLSDDLNANPDNMKTPNYPIDLTDESGNMKVGSKLEMDKTGRFAKLYIEPSDLMGDYDFVADVQSMAVNAGEEEKGARDKAITALLSNQNVLMLLQQEGFSPKFKDLFVTWLEDYGFKDADKFFQKSEQAPGGMPQIPGQPGRPAMPDMPERPGTMQPQAGPTAPPMPPINTGTVNPQELMKLANPNMKLGGM